MKNENDGIVIIIAIITYKPTTIFLKDVKDILYGSSKDEEHVCN